jgi:hypothetical protein
MWEPGDAGLFAEEGVIKPRGAMGREEVRRELEARLRLRPEFRQTEIERLLTLYDGEPLQQKAPNHRIRAGLLMLTGTTAEYAIEFIMAETNRRKVPFAPIEVQPIGPVAGAFALVYPHPVDGRLHMVLDTDMAAESLENIAVVIAHETLHSSLGADSAIQETLAMALDTRVYQEFLLWDPSLALSPTAFTRQQNQLTLALRNSGRFAFPRAGLLARPGVDDVLRGLGEKPVRSFRDLLFQADFYGELRRDGDEGSEVLEAYYRRLSGSNDRLNRLPYDDTTLRLIDTVLDNGFSDADILTIARALRLKAVPLPPREP